MNKVNRSVIEFAERCLVEAERQYGLGDEYSKSDMIYWAAYLDGARDQRKEDDRRWNRLPADPAEVKNDK